MFSKNRDRLLTTDIARKFLAAILAHGQVAPLLSDEHFSVDGTLIKAWASMKSFQPRVDGIPPDKDGGPDEAPSARPEDAAEQPNPESTEMTRPTPRSRNAEVDFRGEKRSSATHASVTDPDARLFEKSPGAGATLCFMGHTLMENRSGLVVQADLTQADGLDPADHLDGEVAQDGLVHQALAVVGAVGEQRLQPRPLGAQGAQHLAGACTVGDVGGGEVDHQEASVGIHGDVALAAHAALGAVPAALGAGGGRLHRLAVEHAGGGAVGAARALTVDHHRQIVDRRKQRQPDQAAEPPVDRLPGREVLRQHPPAAAGAHQIADRVQHLAQIGLARAPKAVREGRRGAIRAHSASVRSVG